MRIKLIRDFKSELNNILLENLSTLGTISDSFKDDELDFVYDLMEQFLYDRIPFTNLYMLMNVILNDEDAALSCSTFLTMHRLKVKENPQKFN